MSRRNRGLARTVGATFAAGGVAKLLHVGPGAALGDRLGLSGRLLVLVGLCELAGGAGVLVGRRDARIGAAAAGGLVALTTLGAGAHLRAGESLGAVVPALALGGASAAVLSGFLAEHHRVDR